jgi:hypothetical protein
MVEPDTQRPFRSLQRFDSHVSEPSKRTETQSGGDRQPGRALHESAMAAWLPTKVHDGLHSHTQQSHAGNPDHKHRMRSHSSFHRCTKTASNASRLACPSWS